MRETIKKTLLAAVVAIPLLLFLADEYPMLRFRGEGHFSGGPVFGYWIRLDPIPFAQNGDYTFHFRGMPNEEMSLQLYTEGEYSRTALTNLSTRLEAILTDQQGREICRGAGAIPKESGPCDECKVWTDDEIKARDQREWILMSGSSKAAYYHVNCLRIPMKPSASYTLKLRIASSDPKTPQINLVPTFEGGQLDLP